MKHVIKRHGSMATLGIIVLTAVIMVSMAGCYTAPQRNVKEPVSGVTYNIAIPAKDIQIIGIVRVETTVDSNYNGEVITYDALLRAAERAGGNGIVNVMIDRKRRGSQATTVFSSPTFDGETWYGSALAIKYTDDNLPSGTPMSTNTSNIEGARQEQSSAPAASGDRLR